MSAAVAAAATAANMSYRSSSAGEKREHLSIPSPQSLQVEAASPPATLSRYESQKRRDWLTFGQYLRNHRPPLTLSRCSGAHVLEFLRYLDQFGKTKVHTETCPYFGNTHPPGPCPCPLKQAWGSLDALIGRLRAAFEENGGSPEMNPFGARAVRLYLREVRDSQAKARGIGYEKKKRRKPQPQQDHELVQEQDPVEESSRLNHQHQHQHHYSYGYGGFVHQLSNSNNAWDNSWSS